MLKSYIKILIRNFSNNKTYSLINLIGLALGISCFTIILLFIENEFSYDTFHHNPENIHRIVKDFRNDDGARIPDATTPPALTNVVRDELPEVEHVTRLFPNWGRTNLVEYGDKKFYEMNLLKIDSSFFQVFDFPFLRGNKANPFHGIHSILITETTARKYFGTENPIGKIMRININNGTDYEVTGVLKDVPHNSHFTFDMLIPFESGRDPNTAWDWYRFYTYTRLKPNTDASLFESNVQNLFKKHQPHSTNEIYIQPLTDIHLKSSLKWELNENGDIAYVRILLMVGIFVLVVATLNYVNLVTANAAKRAKEVGIRKVTGAFKHLLIRQFLFESILMVLISFGFSIIITSLLLPFGNPVMGSDLSQFLRESQWINTILPGVILLIGLLAGIYPALYLSSFQPLRVLRGNFLSSSRGVQLRQGLVVFQFVISSMLIIGFIIIHQQLDFMRNKKLGFDHQNIVMLPNVRGGVGNPEAMAEDLKEIPAVRSVARADGILGFNNSTNGVEDKIGHNHLALNFIRADYNFLQTLGIEIKEGRNFSPEFISDSTAIILNEKAVEQLGLKTPIIGQQLMWDDKPGKMHDVTIVGVVKDFHFTSFHEEIRPFGFILEVNNGSTFFLKVYERNLAGTLKDIEKIWTKHNPDKPFAYSFQDEQMAKLHLSEARFQRLFFSFTLLALLIACLGLFGLVTSLAEAKTKEIGIRKVLGSTVAAIIRLLSKQFVKLVFIALLIACPLAFVGANYWLEGFAYRINIDWTAFVLAGLGTILIALITVSLQATRAALANPVKSLRSE